MNKKKLIKEIANRTGLSMRVSKIVLDSFLQNISRSLMEGNKVALRNFGAFYKTEKQAKRYYDIQTGEIKILPARKTVKFIPYKTFKEQLQLKILDTHIENDGSIGNRITVERYVYSTTQYDSNVKRTNDIRAMHIADKENVAKRIVRKPEVETAKLVFDGKFRFDCFLGEDEHGKFPSLKVPRKEASVLKPQVDRTGATVGIMEPVLRARLRNMCNEIGDVRMLENVKLPILNRNYSYRPDFCLYWEKYNLYLDIEIDEPYDIVSRKPIHFIGCGDNLRDRYFIRNGWCVVRFAEQQIKENIDGVINDVRRMLRWLTDESKIRIQEESLVAIDRWTYQKAEEMALNNKRERYLDLPDSVFPAEKPMIDIAAEFHQKTSDFLKPDEDILPAMIPTPNERKWESIIEEIRQSKCEYCRLTRTNEYQWIYTCKSLKTTSLNGQRFIMGESPLGIDCSFPLEGIEELIPLKELFSDVQWEVGSSVSSKDNDSLESILFDAIANGKPIWIADNNYPFGCSPSFLSNISYITSDYNTPHIGIGFYLKYGMSHVNGYCSNRKAVRDVSIRSIKQIKVLNCSRVYFGNETYAYSFERLVMHPDNKFHKLAFFEDADEILRIMPRREFESAYVQGNLANLEVMKGEIAKAISIYQQMPYSYFIEPSLTWGEACISDIKYFINLFKKHRYGKSFPEGLNASSVLSNFEEVLRLLEKSSWMQS